MKQIIDWSDIEHFSPGEFPAGVLEKIEPGFIYALEFFRVQLGCIVNPSPVKVAGFVRMAARRAVITSAAVASQTLVTCSATAIHSTR